MNTMKINSKPPGALIYYRASEHSKEHTKGEQTPFDVFVAPWGESPAGRSFCLQWPDGIRSGWMPYIRGEYSLNHPLPGKSPKDIHKPASTDQEPICSPADYPRIARKYSVAILDFEAGSVATQQEGAVYADLCRESVYKSGAFSLVERDDMKTLLTEEDFVNSIKCDDTQCLVDFGRKLRAQKIVRGRVAKLDQSVVLTIKVLDVGSGKIDGIVNYNVGASADRLPQFIRSGTCHLLLDVLNQNTVNPR